MAINWNPTPAEEVVQNVRTILATAPGSVPLSRNLGVPQDVVDEPMGTAAAHLQADAIRAIRTYEPRVKVKRVSLSGTADGVLSATAEIVAP